MTTVPTRGLLYGDMYLGVMDIVNASLDKPTAEDIPPDTRFSELGIDLADFGDIMFKIGQQFGYTPRPHEQNETLIRAYIGSDPAFKTFADGVWERIQEQIKEHESSAMEPIRQTSDTW